MFSYVPVFCLCTVISGEDTVILRLFNVGGVTLCNNAYEVKLDYKVRENPPLSSFMKPHHSYICHKMTVMDVRIIVIMLNFGFTHSVHCVYLKLPSCFCLVSAILLEESAVFFNCK